MSDWPEDNFTENDVLTALEKRGLKFKNGHRYIVTQCPTHDDKNPSTQIFKDDWFVNCFAGCGRYHITKAFPELIGKEPLPAAERNFTMNRADTYLEYDLMDWWKKLPLIPRDHQFKTIPLEILDDLGWRWDEPKNSYFIPYFDNLHDTIPFGQWRHLQGDRRFTFLKDAKPTCYGTWNITDGNSRIFIVEGASDCAVLDYAAVPWIGLPSAASGELLTKMAAYCHENGIELVYAGDNDAAGDKLREALDKVCFYRTCQPPKQFKDWGDFLVGTDIEAVQEHAFKVLFSREAAPNDTNAWWKDAKKAVDAGSAKQQPTAAEPTVLY